MSHPRIRSARHADVAAVVDIHTRARRTYYEGIVPEAVLTDPTDADRRSEAFARYVEDSNCSFLCGVHHGELAGFALIGPCRRGPNPTVAELRHLYVAPKRWNRGVGTALHDACLRRWRASGARSALLEVWDGNAHAQAFYDRRGWRPDGYRRTDPADGLTHVGYRLAVGPGE